MSLRVEGGRWGLVIVVLVMLVGSALLLAGRATIAPASFGPEFALVDLSAGVLLAAAAVVAAIRPTVDPISPLAAVVAIAWLSPIVVGWSDGPDAVRSTAAVAAPLVTPALVHLALRGNDRAPARVIVVCAWVFTAALSIAIAVVRDPFLDLNCWANCSANTFLLVPLPGVASALVTLQDISVVGLMILAAGFLVLVHPWRGDADRNLVAVPLIGGLFIQAATALAMLSPVGRPDDPPMPQLHLAGGAALALLSIGLGLSLVRGRIRRSAVLQLAADLTLAAVPSGRLASRLAAALHDPTLEVMYPLPGHAGLFDASGAPANLPSSRSRALTEIRRHGEAIALVVHDRGVLGMPELDKQIGSAARLAVDNERLRAGVLAELAELRASRVRIVEAADTERRRVERNLHDGVQQSLLLLQYELQLSRAAASTEPERQAIMRATQDVQTITENLRNIAHGIYPAVLTDLGLEAALHRLAEDSRLPLIVAVRLDERPPAAVERVAYLLVKAAVESAADPETSMVARISRTDGSIHVDVLGAAVPPATTLIDRVGAFGGSLRFGTQGLKAVLPCA